MMYLEYLRARRAFLWYGAALVVALLFVLVGSLVGNGVHIDVNDTGSQGSKATHISGLALLGPVPIPLEGLAGIAAFFALGFATALAASFSRETGYANFTFVRPISRFRMAGQIAAVDVAAIGLAAVFAFVMEVAAVTVSLGSHAHFFSSPDTGVVVMLGLGTAFMWYGLMQAVSAWADNRGGMYVGITAALMGFSIPLSQATFIGPLVYVFRAILYIDPLAYFHTVAMSGSSVSIGAALGASMALRALTVWLLGFVALALAAFLWNRVEV